METSGVWPVLLPCRDSGTKEIWPTWMEHQGIRLMFVVLNVLLDATRRFTKHAHLIVRDFC